MSIGTAPGRPAGDAERADRVFHALADATRRDIVAVVLQGEHSVSDLARRYPMSFAAVQKHVAVLERAGLVTKRRHGREQRVSGRVETLRHARGLLDRLEAVWRARVERIDDLLAEPTPPASPEPPTDRPIDPEGAPA
ncbi:MAG: ArsR/SmtB family transcription factor [Actinomycetales bacterium]